MLESASESSQIPLPESFDALSNGVLENPYDFFRSLRNHAPVYQIPGTNWYTVSRYQDVLEITLNTDDFSSNLTSIIMNGPNGEPSELERPQLDTGPMDVLAIADPPAHKPQRRLAQKALSMRFVQSLEPIIRQQANDIIDRFIDDGKCDWVQAFAKEIPMTISLALAGFPTEDWQQVKAWSDNAIALLSGINTVDNFGDNIIGANAMWEYTEQHYLRIENEPGDNFTSALIAATRDDNQPLLRREAISMVFQLLIAGSDSTANTMGNTVKILATQTNLQQQIRGNPDLLYNFIEEVLRLETPFMGHFRQTKKEVSVAGITIPEGARLMLMWASANRDETVFNSPNDIDLQRDQKTQKHFSFGYGVHNCLGAHLARTEIHLALEELLKRTTSISVDKTEAVPDHIPSVFIRELHHLPILFSASSKIPTLE
ncbi:MAG: cytochrome P450 [Chitinophagales bacterium]|jgi:cytochrome P450